MKEIDPEVIKSAIDEISKRRANYEYFFNQLKSPDWIRPLSEKGFFKKPPQVERIDNNLRFPPWPESDYLARMAEHAPELVQNILINIPGTDNVSVHEDILDAACAMPPELAKAISKKESNWIKSQNDLHYLIPDKFTSLIIHLLKGNQKKEALGLAQNLLSILPDQRDKSTFEKAEDSPLGLPRPEPRARFDAWGYGEILNKLIPELLASAIDEGLNLICNLLENFIRLSRTASEQEMNEDYSYIKRPSIETPKPYRENDLEDILISALRDIAEMAIEKRGKSVLEITESHRYMIFQRMGLYLREKFPEIDPEGTEEKINDPEFIWTNSLHHELFHFLHRHFNRLSDSTQQNYLNIISQAREYFNKHYPGEEKLYNDPGDFERSLRHWQYRRLYPIKHFLKDSWKEQFELFKKEFGDLIKSDFKSWVGPTSPKTSDEISSMTIDELISFLKTWEPPEGHMVPSPEGLGRMLDSHIANQPKLYAIAATRFQGLDPTYVRAILSGLRDALKNGITFEWSPVLNLCHWVLCQPREISERRSEYSNLDPGWVWTRKTIADLLSSGFDSCPGEFPFIFRNTVWEVLEPLTRDPEPTPEYEEKYGGSNMDPITLSINTTRGRAIHAVVGYALWIRRNIEKLPDSKERIARGLGEMPEVLQILDFHLDIEQEPSLAIHAVYGQWFPWLDLIDSDWAQASKSRIFPRGEDSTGLWKAAWNTYISFCQPFDKMLDVLYEQYGTAIDRLAIDGAERDSDESRGLIQHLIAYFWRGKLDLETKGLLPRLFAKAPSSLRHYAFEFVGLSLRSTKGIIEPDVAERLKSLWLWRKHYIEISNSRDYSELSAFGLWFASRKFDEFWAISQLVEVLRLSGRLVPDYEVLEYLAFLSDSMLAPAVECYYLLVKNAKEFWHLIRWSKDAELILKNALDSDNESARQMAIDTIHYLGTIGYHNFRSLLKEQKKENGEK